MKASSTLAVAVVVLSACLAGCDPFQATETARESHAFELNGDIPRIAVRLDRGRVMVTGSSFGAVEIDVRKRARAIDRESARRLLDLVEVEFEQTADEIRVESLSSLEDSPLAGGWVATELELRVPDNVVLDLRTGDGSVEVRDVVGEISVESGDGRVELFDVSGNVRIRTADGRIKGRSLSGSVDARTEDGRIELEGRFERLDATTGDGSIRVEVREQGERSLEHGWTLRTSDGSVRLVLPPTLSAELEASTLDGSIDVDLSSFTGEGGEGRFVGTLGAGGALILVQTMDGSIRLEAR